MEALKLNEPEDNLPIPKPQPNAMVFGTLDPQGVIEKATAIANKLKPIVDQAKLYSMISGKKHVKAEGWSTMLAMLGIFPSTEYSRRLEREGEIAYESRVVLKHLSGLEVGAGEAICSSNERNWSGRDEFTIKSMSQTRALGKAARIGFSFIMCLAGYEPTSAEEMPHEMKSNEVDPHVEDVPDKHEELGVFVPSGVKAFRSKKGSEYYKIMSSDGSLYITFDKKQAEIARLASQSGVEIVVTYTEDKYGKKVVYLEMKDDGGSTPHA